MGSWLSKVWTSSVPSAELFSVYPPQTFSLVQRYLEKKERKGNLFNQNHFTTSNVNNVINISETYVLSACFCAARCRSSRAPSSSSSLFPSVESSDWLLRCEDAPWHPCALLWLSPSPLHLLAPPRPPSSAAPLPVDKTSNPCWSHAERTRQRCWRNSDRILTSSLRLS